MYFQSFQEYISHVFSIVFLTGLQSYISTIVFSRRLYHSGVELPIVSSSKLGSISLTVFRRKQINFVKTAAFAFGLPSVSGLARSPTVRLLNRQTTVCALVCLLVCPNRICWSDCQMSEPGAPALTCPCALHHHPCAVSQRLSPTDVLHRLQHLVERQGWGWQREEEV